MWISEEMSRYSGMDSSCAEVPQGVSACGSSGFTVGQGRRWMSGGVERGDAGHPLYQQILGLSDPWFVSSVKLDIPQGRVDIEVEHRPDARWTCPVCGQAVALYDHAERPRGGTWIPASSRPTCTPGFPGWAARSTGSAMPPCLGANAAAASRC